MAFKQIAFKQIAFENATRTKSTLLLLAATTCAAILFTGLLASANDGSPPLEQLLNALPPITSDDKIRLRSDVNLPASQEICSRLHQIFDFDLNIQGLKNDPRVNRPLEVGLASEQKIASLINTRMGGRALGARAFVSHAQGFTGSTAAYDWYVAGHEIEHVIMARLGATQPALPTYLVEGIACSVGAHCCRELGIGSKALQQQAKKLSQVSAQDVEDVFQNFRVSSDIAEFRNTGKLFIGEHIGGLFVEFMACRMSDSPSKFFLNWAAFSKRLGGGTPFETAFQQEFGFSIEKAQSEFIQFIRRTENNPAARFQNTVYQGFAV